MVSIKVVWQPPRCHNRRNLVTAGRREKKVSKRVRYTVYAVVIVATLWGALADKLIIFMIGYVGAGLMGIAGLINAYRRKRRS